MATKEQEQTKETPRPAATAAFERATAEQPSHYDPDGAHRPAPGGEGTPDAAERAGGGGAAHDDGAASTTRTTAQDVARAQPPAELLELRQSEPSAAAGGVPSIAATMKYALGEMGLTRSLRTLARINQPEGFDCPGCAWPEPDRERGHIEFCENGAKHVADEATTKRVTPDFFRRWSVPQLAEQTDVWLNQQGRLTQPMLLRRGRAHYEPVSWDEAFGLLAAELNALASPDEAVFYTSGRTSNEAAFLYQLFVRQFGTNNLPDCSNMCHESSGTGLTESIGVGKGTVTLDDFAATDAIFIVGQNPGTNHPRMLTTLQQAKRRGCRIVHVNPLPEAGLHAFKHPQEILHLLGAGTLLADIFLQVRVNGDVALLKGIMKEVLAAERRAPGTVFDHKFIAEHTHGFEEFVAALDAVSWDEIEAACGVARAELRAAADVYVEARSVIVCWAMGLTQHRNAVANIQEIVNLLLLRGNIGRAGAGACPVRGHSNVQGDRTMGIWERPTETFLDSLAREFQFEPPRAHGYDTVNAIKAMHGGAAKVFFALGGNFLSATPDTEYTARALRRCRLTAHVSTKLNRAHLVTGEQALILPCLGRTERDVQASGEQFVSCENSMGVVQASRGRLEPASEYLLSEPLIVARLAEATLGARSRVDWRALAADYDRVRAHIERVVPGFADYNRRVRAAGGFYLPNAARERVFKTATGRAQFTVHPLPRHELAPGQFLMMTIRSHDQFNTTVYSFDDRYRGISNERRVVLLHKDDIEAAGLHERQVVDLVSHFEGEERVAHRFVVVPYRIPRGCAATYFPEANVLVPVGHVAARSNTPASKSVVISLRPVAFETPGA
jgi:molybdopterin-dependent oxidoreductase alpha subunit